jgi:uncharacterized protein with FMN-binding domain
MVKKLILSVTVIVSFILYSIFERTQSATIPKASQGSNVSNEQDANSTSSPPDTNTNSFFKDGIYTGTTEDVFYGDIQVRATVINNRLSTIEFLKYPDDQQTSIMINTQMMPILLQEAIQKQSSEVDIVSGATDSSEGFIRSLAAALAQAK